MPTLTNGQVTAIRSEISDGRAMHKRLNTLQSALIDVTPEPDNLPELLLALSTVEVMNLRLSAAWKAVLSADGR